MNVSAVIVTRGNVDLTPILQSLPDAWEIIVWDNGLGCVWKATGTDPGFQADVPDLSVYGRYAAIEYASHDLIYVQDDDVIVSDPLAVAQVWEMNEYGTQPGDLLGGMRVMSNPGSLVANMPPEFNHDGYTDSCLVGFGACFHRDTPSRSFSRFGAMWPLVGEEDYFDRTCDVVFTALTPRVLVDVPIVHREFASDPDRMWKQPEHYGERVRMLEFARQVRDS